MLNQKIQNSTPGVQIRQRFDVLDGLRGIAAILVMLLHYAAHNGLAWFAGAWICVDLFFILSGFVIAHSYGKKIASGLPFRDFLILRIIRLAPLYFLGLFLGIIAFFLAASKNPSIPVSLTEISYAISLAALGLPYLNHVAWPFGNGDVLGAIFPLNDPAWTLFFEFFINLIFFGYVRYFKRSSSVRLVATSFFVVMVCALWFKQIHSGWGSDNFIFGFPRVFLGFFLGALIFSEIKFFEYFPVRFGYILAFIFFGLCWVQNGKLAFFISVVFAPLTIALCASAQVSDLIKRCCDQLGNISYPLYILHIPLYRLGVVFYGDHVTAQVPRVILASLSAVAIASVAAHLDTLIRKKIMALYYPPRATQPLP
jgi:peptidoglycan/LPS O-acetylase OafA/YrhL